MVLLLKQENVYTARQLGFAVEQQNYPLADQYFTICKAGGD